MHRHAGGIRLQQPEFFRRSQYLSGHARLWRRQLRLVRHHQPGGPEPRQTVVPVR